MADDSTSIDDSGHIMYVCPPDCENAYCSYCQGGLYLCTRCNLLEGALTSECPGRPVGKETVDLTYADSIDFKRECWLVGNASPHSPAHPSKI